jgi:UDPglucose 6-dehydrogenase
MMAGTRIAVLGLWHQGIVGAACLADLGYDIVAADTNADLIAGLRKGEVPIFEPGLTELTRKGLQNGKLAFTADLAEAVTGAQFVFVMFDTPVDEEDRSDLSGIFAACEDIAQHLADDAIVYVTAQVPVGTCARMLKILRGGGQEGVSIAYSPENLRLGQAIERYLKPPLPVLGTDDDKTYERLTELLAPLSTDWRRCNVVTAEMSKHALNAFLAVSICFANELGNLCDAVGADGAKLAELLRLEPRVGPKAMLMPGLGFAGGTLARDIITLRGLGDASGVDTPALDGAWVSNGQQNRMVVKRLREMLGELKGKRIAILGITYKPDTSTLRRSAAMEVIAELARLGVRITAHDPAADSGELAAYTGFAVVDDPYEAADGADALVLMTPWADYAGFDFARAAAAMGGDLVFDTAGLWKPAAAEAHGLRYLDIGRGRR